MRLCSKLLRAYYVENVSKLEFRGIRVFYVPQCGFGLIIRLEIDTTLSGISLFFCSKDGFLSLTSASAELILKKKCSFLPKIIIVEELINFDANVAVSYLKLRSEL